MDGGLDWEKNKILENLNRLGRWQGRLGLTYVSEYYL